jgi:hypothetical protein
MNRKTFHTELAKVLQVSPEEMVGDLVLENCNWDSLAQVSALMVIDAHGERRVGPGELANCKTLADVDRLAFNAA